MNVLCQFYSQRVSGLSPEKLGGILGTGGGEHSLSQLYFPSVPQKTIQEIISSKQISIFVM